MLSLPVRRPQSDLVVRGVAKAFLSKHRIIPGQVLLHDDCGVFASADVRECAKLDGDANEAAVTKAERESAYKDHAFMCRLASMTPMKITPGPDFDHDGNVAYVVKTKGDSKRSAWRDVTTMATRLRNLCAELADSHDSLAVRAVAKGVAKYLRPLGESSPWTGGPALTEFSAAAEDLPAGDFLHRASAQLRDLILAHDVEKRALPVLKHPDPKALLAFDNPAYLSRIKRDARLGADQLLVNELKLDAYKEPQAWAIVRQEKAEPMDALTDAVSARVSPFEREEYAAEKDFYFIPLTVVSRFKAPLDMPQGWRGARTFSPEADLGEVIKAEMDAFDPEKAADYSDADLQKYLDELCGLALQANGSDREKYVNYILFLRAELQRRGKEPKIPEALQGELEALTKADRKLAAVYQSGEDKSDPLALDSVLKHVKPIVLRRDAVCVVGSVANHGQTRNDIDVLVKGPLDDATRHVIKFRVGRMFPPEISERVSFIDDDLGGPMTSHVPLYDLALIPREPFQLVEMRDIEVEKATDPLLEYPPLGKHDAVLQLHFRGASLHVDFRIKVDGKLIGFTLSLQTKAVPAVETVADARKIAASFDLENGSRYNKPMHAPDGIYAVPKAEEQPIEWLTIDDKVFEPGEVGAGTNVKGVMVILDKLKVEWGAQEDFFHEYFVSGSRHGFNGRLVLRKLPGRGPASSADDSEGKTTPEGQTYWRAMFADPMPYVLTRRAMNQDFMPPDRQSALPAEIMDAIPKELRYWTMKGAEARKARDEIIERKIISIEKADITYDEESTIIRENQKKPEAQRPHKFKAAEWTFKNGHPRCILCGDEENTNGMCDGFVAKADARFRLLYQHFKGQEVTRTGPSRERYILALGGSVKMAVAFDGQPGPGTQVSGVKLPWDDALMGDEVTGYVEPGRKFGSLTLNDTKDTDSWIEEADSGDVGVKYDTDSDLLFLDFGGKILDGDITLAPEENGGDMWILRSATLKSFAVEDGVQYWHEHLMRNDDDKGGDRKSLKPIAFFKPMKPSPRTSFTDIDELKDKFLTPQALKIGAVVQPKMNGFSIVCEVTRDGKVVMFTEDSWTDYSKSWPEAADELREWFRGTDAVIVGEFMAFYDVEMKNPVPRRELASYRSMKIPEDKFYAVMVHDVIYLDGENLTGEWYDKRIDYLDKIFKGKKLKHFYEVKSETVHTLGEFDDARDDMMKEPGAEGIMAKMISSTYSLGGENDAWAKCKTTATLTAVIYDRHEVKGSPGVYNFHCAIGPVKEPDKWRDTVEVDGKTYAVVGVTGNAKIDATNGDRIRVEVLEIFHYEYSDGKEGVHWFGPPVVLEATDQAVTSIEDFDVLGPQEVSERAVKRWIAKDGGDEQYVLGVVMEPLAGGGEHDSQRDFYNEDDIWHAFKYWTQNHRRFGVMHKGKVDEGKVILGENYIAPLDIVISGSTVKKGSWLAGAWIVDKALWKDAKSGKFQTWSIGGYGRRIPSNGG